MNKSMTKKKIRNGDYKLWVVKVDEPTGDSLHITFRVWCGPLVAKWFPLTDGAVDLYSMLIACGMKSLEMAEVDLDLDKLVGLECTGTITDGKLTFVKPEEDLFSDDEEDSNVGVREFAGPMPRYLM